MTEFSKPESEMQLREGLGMAPVSQGSGCQKTNTYSPQNIKEKEGNEAPKKGRNKKKKKNKIGGVGLSSYNFRLIRCLDAGELSSCPSHQELYAEVMKLRSEIKERSAQAQKTMLESKQLDSDIARVFSELTQLNRMLDPVWLRYTLDTLRDQIASNAQEGWSWFDIPPSERQQMAVKHLTQLQWDSSLQFNNDPTAISLFLLNSHSWARERSDMTAHSGAKSSDVTNYILPALSTDEEEGMMADIYKLVHGCEPSEDEVADAPVPSI